MYLSRWMLSHSAMLSWPPLAYVSFLIAHVRMCYVSARPLGHGIPHVTEGSTAGSIWGGRCTQTGWLGSLMLAPTYSRLCPSSLLSTMYWMHGSAGHMLSLRYPEG